MTEAMTRSAARRASKKTQHVRSFGDWATLIILIAAALLIFWRYLYSRKLRPEIAAKGSV